MVDGLFLASNYKEFSKSYLNLPLESGLGGHKVSFNFIDLWPPANHNYMFLHSKNQEWKGLLRYICEIWFFLRRSDENMSNFSALIHRRHYNSFQSDVTLYFVCVEDLCVKIWIFDWIIGSLKKLPLYRRLFLAPA